MATAPTVPLVSVDEYLRSSYEHDMEFVDGVLVERSVPTMFHGLLQAILLGYFRSIEHEYRIKVLPEVRTRIIERARYRIPDILLCATPIRMERVMNEVPVAVIEILSPDDKFGETLERFRDYEQLGVSAIVQMDPEKFLAHRFERGCLIEMQFQTLCTLPHVGRTVPFDSEAFFTQLRDELASAAAGL